MIYFIFQCSPAKSIFNSFSGRFAENRRDQEWVTEVPDKLVQIADLLRSNCISRSCGARNLPPGTAGSRAPGVSGCQPHGSGGSHSFQNLSVSRGPAVAKAKNRRAPRPPTPRQTCLPTLKNSTETIPRSGMRRRNFSFRKIGLCWTDHRSRFLFTQKASSTI